MDLILTHEQADFDAIAGLLGASLLQEGSIAVLPRKVNRNVRSFLALYGGELNFTEARDIPRDKVISRLTLVDTQSLVTLKGFNRQTQVTVIDHHAIRENIDPSWVLRTDSVGAVTTQLVEAIRERSLPLTTIQATLLLLGIYEDTGSLSYASTTARDIHCAAYLLEQGGSLAIAVNFLNPPLSEGQKELYDLLLSKAATHTIHGMQIVLSTACAPGLSEEISSIAHKMRDLLEPDGLVLVVATVEGFRMVLRSTSDYVNVAKIAAHFGGGGHERAAAALIHHAPGAGESGDSEKLAQISAEILQLLPALVHSPVTVKQIMSRRPRLIPPDLPVESASALMQKYGYEGFPVADGGKVVGLLTRRAVDRAIAHHLNLPASSLMEAGAVTIFPTDSIDHLQNLMTESGWGQIPVLDPESGEITGIVTRTDLLKTLSAKTRNPRTHHLAALLEKSLTPQQLSLLQVIAAQATRLHMAVYVVGGFVRDLILHRPIVDMDIVVEGDAIYLAETLRKQHGGRLICHHRFGTAKWYLDTSDKKLRSIPGLSDMPEGGTGLPASLDLITARTEFYEHPTALPTVERSSIKLDLHRRDFTINTMAIRLDGHHYGELLDHYGGYNDLKKGIIRVLHSLSFIDDPTRAIRAVRFEQRFNFHIEPRTLELMGGALDQLRTVTGERLRHELDLILHEEDPARMLTRLEDLSLLSAIHPWLGWDRSLSPDLTRLLSGVPAPEWNLAERIWGQPLRRVLGYTLWLMGCDESQIAMLVHRLRLPASFRGVITAAHQLNLELPALEGQSVSTITARLETVHPAAIFCVYHRLQDPVRQQIIEKYIYSWQNIHPSFDGNNLLAMGVPTGPHYRQILNRLRSAWLDGVISNKDEEKSMLYRLISEYGYRIR